jgi:3-phenylpropionate/trans-cinnamate dioxygenase ferredoxin reductase subunit
MTRHVIIGAGEAGLRAALALRDAGETDVLLLGAETPPPYERPALSKPDASAGHHKPIAADLAGIDVRLGSAVAAVDRSAARVLLQDGGTIAYDRLLLATGARPRLLPSDPGGVALTLRTLAHAEAIYGRARPGAAAVIVGAGLIGLEMAAELRRRDLAVTVLEAGPRVLGRGVPAEVAAVIAARHAAAGVDIRVDQRIEHVEPGAVHLSDGVSLPADLVVAAVGVVPDVDLAEASGLACGNGIHVDARLRTSDPAIFAAGDCAAVDHPRYGRVRFETWRNACDQGAHAARSMLGAEEPYAALPWFWSDHHDLGLQAVGLHDATRRAVRRNYPGGGFLRFELDDAGRLAAAAGVGPGTTVAKDIRLAEMLIARGAAPDPAALADPDANLKAALRAA